MAEMDVCIDIATNLERLANDPGTKTRTTHPVTAFGQQSRADLSKGQADVLRVFEAWPNLALDEQDLTSRYLQLYNIEIGSDRDDALKWMPPKASTLRARRSDLEKQGYITRVDNLGESLTGRPAGRYQLVPPEPQQPTLDTSWSS